MDFLSRDDAPLSAAQWAELDNVVTEVVKRFIVGRRFIPLYGPLGAGLPVVPSPRLRVGPDEPVADIGTQMLELAEISEDFVFNWKALERAERLEIPIDWAVAAAAAYQLALKEDALVIGGLWATEGRLSLEAGDWSAAGGILNDATRAIASLGASGHPGPYALVISPHTHSKLYRFYGDGGVMEITMLEDLLQSGVLTSVHVSDNQALIVETGALNMDIAVGLDVRTAFLGPEGMNYPFRILETLALRVKRPTSVCAISG